MANSKAKKPNKIVKQIIGLVVVLALLVAISTLATLMVAGKIEILPEAAEPIGYIGDAENICHHQVMQDHGDMLAAISIDDRSSHYDQASGKYKLFYQLDVYRDANKQSGVNVFYVNCMVSSSRGVIARMEYLEQVDFKPKAIRREKGNAFGF